MKPGDCVIWLHSPKRSFLRDRQAARIPGEIVRINPQLIRIRVLLRGKERYVNVHPENVLCDAED